MDIISYALSKKGMQQSVSDYLDEHLTNPTNPPLDTSLTIANAAADSKATGDKLSELKEGLSAIQTATSSDVGKALKAKTVTDGKVVEWEFGEVGTAELSTITEKMELFESANIYDVAKGVDGLINLSGVISANNTQITSDFIPVEEDDVIHAFYVPSGIYPANMSRVCAYDENKAPISASGATDVKVYTVPSGVKFIRFSANKALENVMLIVGDTVPNAYIPYARYYVAKRDFVDGCLSDVIENAETAKRTKKTVDAIASIYSNIFDKDATSEIGYLINGVLQSGSGAKTYDFMDVEDHGEYITNAIPRLYYGGNYNNSVAFYDENKGFISSAVITILDETDQTHAIGTFVIPDGVAYIRVTIAAPIPTDVMYIRGSELPQSYVPFGEHLVVNDALVEAFHGNPLTGKIAVFDGDSICASLTDHSNNGSYAGRIEVSNGIKTYNYAVGGGTITSGTYSSGTARHWVVDSIDTIYTQHPDADYIILEGGTNDADNIGSILNGATPEKFGTFNLTDFSGQYDKTTFCGAVETLFYKAINYYASKKIGFVIAPKMGKTSSGYGASVNNRSAYFKTIKDICEKWGVPCLDLWNGCYMNPSLTACYDSSKTVDENIDEGKLYMDGQHPTPTGYDYIAPIIGAWMKTL